VFLDMTPYILVEKHLEVSTRIYGVTFLLFSPCIVNDYYLLVPINAHIMPIYISPYLAATCFGWSPSSGSSLPNGLKLTAINQNLLL
jgi:hypothetical protein